MSENSTSVSERLRYLTNGKIREEIAYAAGCDPTRYGAGTEKGLKKADMLRIAEQLQPDDSEIDLLNCELRKLYELVCEWAGGEYSPNAGCPWGLNRDNLKKIHQAVGGRPPEEVPTP